MKRYFLLLLSLLFCLGLFAETKNINLSFNKSDFIFENIGNSTSITSIVHPIYISNDTCLPALPMIPLSVQIENSQDFESLSYLHNDTLIGNNITIERNKPIITTNNDTLFYATNSGNVKNIFPENIVKYTGSSTIDGYKIISFLVCPFIYDTLNRELYLINNLSIEITLNSSEGKIKQTDNKSGKRMSRIVRNIVENKQGINIIPTPIVHYDYLIITNNLLKNSFQKLAKWKSVKGVRTKVLTVEEIDSIYNENSLQDKIKKAIKYYYDGDYIGLRYVLLGGDESVVPAHHTFIKIKNDKDTCVSDVFYGCLDNLGWNNAMNVGIESIYNNIDITADVIVSRLCVNTEYSANTQINRIIKYESQPDTTNWEDKILMTGAMPEINIYEAGESTYNLYIGPYWNGFQTRFYDTYTDFVGCENYNVAASLLKDEFEKGYTFVNMDFHGDSLNLKLETDRFTYLDARYINNRKNSIIITSACNTNDFSISPKCISEEFMRGANGGILAYLGSSQKGFIGASFFFNRFIYEYLLTSENQQLGDAYFFAKTMYSQMWDRNTNELNTYRYLYHSINLLGDPEMPVYLSKPKTFSNVEITYDNGFISIETGIDSCKICVSSAEDDLYYYIKENTNNTLLSNLNNLYYICITKPGYIPYVAQVGNEVFLQNEVIVDNKDIYSTKTYIGNNVTNTQEYGDVIIENGKTTITHTQGVHITKGFKVENGAEFIILNNSNRDKSK